MSVGRLLRESEMQFDKRPEQAQQVFSGNVFAAGARWMFGQLHEAELEAATAFDASVVC